jgi:UDP-glucose 4-epimerase
MRILLTGGAGYVGSACLRWLLEHGHDAVAYDNLAEGNAQAVPPGRLVIGDVLDTPALAEALRKHGAEAVMHFAALAVVPESIREPARYWHVNVAGTRSVLEAMRIAAVDRVVFSSTAATYDFDAPMPLTEDSPQRPRSPYGTTKLAAEQMIRDFALAYGMGAAILRYFNASGADPDGWHGEDRRHETHLIPLILQAAVGNRPRVLIYGGDWPTRDGTCERDYVHTRDLAEAHRLAIEKVQPGSVLVYNVGTGTGTTVLEALRACQAVVGRTIPHETVGRRDGDPPVLIASPCRLEQELGWKPRYCHIEPIVETAWRWHQAFPRGYQSAVEVQP